MYIAFFIQLDTSVSLQKICLGMISVGLNDLLDILVTFYNKVSFVNIG